MERGHPALRYPSERLSSAITPGPDMSQSTNPSESWQEDLFQAIKRADVRQVAYVPDAGHAHVIRRAIADPDINDVVLTTEEEGVALACGAWLGGQRAVLLMQSSGVGNCINMFSLLTSGNFPFFAVVTMRGEFAEFNPWQGPMGRATPAALELMGRHHARQPAAQQHPHQARADQGQGGADEHDHRTSRLSGEQQSG